MTSFEPYGTYVRERDIRFDGNSHPSWAGPLVAARLPNAQCWLVVMPRRGGKTWLAGAVREARGTQAATLIADLRYKRTARKAGVEHLLTGREGKDKPPRSGVLIIDEPGPVVDPEIAPVFVSGLNALRDDGVATIVLLTPGECRQLRPYLDPESYKDMIFPPELQLEEVGRMATRADWASDVVERFRVFAPHWLQTPFLLELLLKVAELNPDHRADAAWLERAARDVARNDRYLDQLVHNGLTVEQRSELRAVRWRTAGLDLRQRPDDGLVTRTTIPKDPILDQHLPDVLRIHHLSDLHHGGSLRANVDAKDRSRAGQQLAALAGAGSPLDSYVSHVRQLHDRGDAPHLLIITGDVVNRPEDPSGTAALKWLEELSALLLPHPDLRPEDPRIVLVGGNHDVSWDLALDPDRQARHQWFARTFAHYPHPDLDLAEAADRRLEIRYADAGVRLLLLGSAESGGEAIRDEERRLVEEYQAKLAGESDETSIRDLVRGLERIDPGVVSRKVLDRISAERGWLSIALLHHPVSPVPAVEVAPYSGIVNAGQTKQVLIGARTALVLHGHTHMAFLAAERMLGAGSEWTMRIAGAASLAASTTDEQNGYNQVFLAREGSGHRAVVRPMRFDGGSWRPQQAFAFHPGAPAECTFDDLVSDPPADRSG